MKIIFLFLGLVFQLNMAFSLEMPKKTKYELKSELIDVVIHADSRDLETLKICIEGIKTSCNQLRNIFVVSDELLTDEAEWFDQKLFPFTRYDVAFHLNNKNDVQTQDFLAKSPLEADFYFHQLIQLYASKVIPGVSSNVLILDPDIVFFNKVDFFNSNSGGLYAPTTNVNIVYMKHAQALVPNFKPYFFTYSGMTHHLLIQRPVLEELFEITENYHGMDFWKAFCLNVEADDLLACNASVHEVYFNYVFSKTNQVKIRRLKGFNAFSLSAIAPLKDYGYHYVICPRETRKWLSELIDKSKIEQRSEGNGATGTTLLILPQLQSIQKMSLSLMQEES